MKAQRAGQLLDTVIDAACRAADAIMAVYRRADVDVSLKADQSPVTAADLAAHRCIASALDGVLPGVPLMSEEGAIPSFSGRRDWHRFWLVDPLDGTREFIQRTGEFAVSIALVEDGYPVLGVIASPVTGLVYAAVNMAYRTPLAFCRWPDGSQRPLQTRQLPQDTGLDYPFRVVMSKRYLEVEASPTLAQLRLSLPTAQCFSAGSALKFCRVAEGAADLYPALLPTSEWDSAAGQVLVEAAGGRVMALDGSRLRYNQESSLINPPFVAAGAGALDWGPLLARLRTGNA